ncbi:MAG TPA: patatin-like phospholipase family protein [Bacteroidetes bacterium]|nr:patatin-like phospholipase family protein [Bacteroidota bacterium]
MISQIKKGILLFLILLTSCSPKFLKIDQSQFIKDGDRVPIVNLFAYRSVQERENQNPDLAVVMAISGGGHRAANFSMGILLGLEKITLGQRRNALAEIDYFSTVSGGGFAAGAYMAALYDHYLERSDDAFSLSYYYEQRIQFALKRSYVGNIVLATLNPALWFTHADDGDALEKSIDDYVCGRKFRKGSGKARVPTVSLGDLFVSKTNPLGKVRFPMMIANCSILGKMAIFPFTPDILEQYKISGYTHRYKKVLAPKYNAYTVPLSVGIKASGSFPVLISNTTLRSNYHPKRKFLHLIDGAMTDNTGYQTAIDILHQEDKVKRKALFIVDADNVGNASTFSKKEQAQISLKVYARLASSGLDARRIQQQKEIELMADEIGFKPVYFGFNAFLKRNVTVPKKIKIKEEQQRLIHLLEQNEDLSAFDSQILYELLTNIITKYSIKEAEQKLLILGGQYLVKIKEAEIRKALGF